MMKKMNEVIKIENVDKQYEGGFKALSDVSLSIKAGEIFALLGPNGAGKTTLISMICGLTRVTHGQIVVGGHNVVDDYKDARRLIGLVPQELTVNMFETVWDTVSFSRGVFGLNPNPEYIETLLKRLSLWDKRKNPMMTLSGGMKRRVMIAKALAHEPKILFLDEPTAGVDVELRKDMWAQIHTLRNTGVTIILTTHYIEEAEEMADRIGVINKGKLILVENKQTLIKKLAKKYLTIDLAAPLAPVPEALTPFKVTVNNQTLRYEYDTSVSGTHICDLFDALKAENITFTDIHTKQSTLEEIFVELVKHP